MMSNEQKKAVQEMAADFENRTEAGKTAAASVLEKKKLAEMRRAAAERGEEARPASGQGGARRQTREAEPQRHAELAPTARRAGRPGQSQNQDREWVNANLRLENGLPYRDLANILRILATHPDFQGRFRFNKAMGKVMDRGAVMLDWQVDDLTAVLQERFLPEISEDVVAKALMVSANRKAPASI